MDVFRVNFFEMLRISLEFTRETSASAYVSLQNVYLSSFGLSVDVYPVGMCSPP